MFDRNQEHFATFAHRNIWHRGLMLMPPEQTLANIENYRRGSFSDLYNYLADAYSDMYKNPSTYCIDCYGIEEQLHGQSFRQAMTTARNNKQKARLRILESIDQTILPRALLERMLDYIKKIDNKYVIETATFDKEFVNKIKKGRNKTDEDTITFLEHLGIRIDCLGDYVALSSSRHPRMFEALFEWKELLDTNKKTSNRYRFRVAFRHLDYRAFLPGYENTLESSAWYMSDNVVECLTQIKDLLDSLGLKLRKPDNNLALSLGCDYKGSHLVYFTYDHTYPVLRTCMFPRDSMHYSLFEDAVKNHPLGGALTEFCLQNINRCKKCPCKPIHPSQLGYWTNVFGKQANLCWCNRYFETNEFTPVSYEMMKALIFINHEILKNIDEL